MSALLRPIGVSSAAKTPRFAMTEPRVRLPEKMGAPSSSGGAARPQYMPQLDGLRAFAVMAVMFQHFYGSRIGLDWPIGEWGVQLFFVLSGFLITGILLGCRETNAARPFQLRQFYIRRALRIWPLFYLVVLGAAALDIRPMRENLWWHLTYASNILVALRGGWIGPASHLWSLAVEEQFYLLWPWLMLWLPTKYLRPAILLAIAAAPIYKIVGHFAGLNTISLFVLTIGCLDALGIGALLALYRRQKPALCDDLTRDKRYNWLGFAAFCGAILSCVFWRSHLWIQIAGSLCATLFFAWLVHRGAHGFGGATATLLTWKPLIYLGQISYGLYLFHKFLTVVVPHVFEALQLSYPDEPVAQAVLLISINIALASCSWFWFEKPINSWKKRFPYARAS